MVFAMIVVAAAVPAAFATGAVAAVPQPLDIPEVAQKGLLLPIHVARITEHLRFYANLIRDAKDQAGIDRGRIGLIRTFTYSPYASFRYTVAQLAVKTVAPLLDLPDPIRQVNIAIALSQMPQVTIQPALEKMIVHHNPAVRLLGWQGYRAAWMPIVRQGLTPAKTMFTSLSERAGKEDSPPVVAAIWKMLMFRGTVISLPEGLGDLDRMGMEILRKSWPIQCWKMRMGSAEMANAALKGLATAVEYAANAMVAKNSQGTSQAVQLIADMMWCSAKAYGDAYRSGDSGKAVVSANTLLLLECERSLNQLLCLGPMDRKDYLRSPLISSRKEFKDGRDDKVMYYVDPKSDRKYGVLAWADYLKTRFGIKDPSAGRLEPQPATQPATVPARDK